jgi:hypothetical protein
VIGEALAGQRRLVVLSTFFVTAWQSGEVAVPLPVPRRWGCLISIPATSRMSGMTGDVRDRILGLLSAGPATVARLAAGLGVPGGVVSYELKLLERDGLVRVGTTRLDQGVPTPLYVSTAAAAPPPLQVPIPLPGLTFTGDGPYPAPLWTVPSPTPSTDKEPGEPDEAGRVGPAGGEHEGTAAAAPFGAEYGSEPGAAAGAQPGTTWSPGRSKASSAGTNRDASAALATGGPSPARPSASPPRPRQPLPSTESPRDPRLLDVRRVPMDDATFYEFAARLDALAREFAARATPGAPSTELTIRLTRPEGETGYGYGS